MAPQSNKRSRTQKPKTGRTAKGRPSTKSSKGGASSKGRPPKKGRPAKGRAKGKAAKGATAPATSLKSAPPKSSSSIERARTVRSKAASAGEGERLQKVLSSAGIASRRECEQLILDGRVEVNGKVVTELGTRVVIGKHEVRFDCEPIEVSRPKYYLVNKPMGVVSTNLDPDGRPRVIDLVPPAGHLFSVGRLDRSSEGLILVTNDGELANKLAHPRYEIPKVYRVTVAGHPTSQSLQKLRRGVWLAEGQVRVSRLLVKKRQSKNTILEMVLTEGRNREIRRMAASIGHKVLELRRIALGPLRLGEVPAGAYRELTSREIKTVKDLVKGKTRAAKKRRPPSKFGGKTASGGKRVSVGGRGGAGKGKKKAAHPKVGNPKAGKRQTARKPTKRKSTGRKVARSSS